MLTQRQKENISMATELTRIASKKREIFKEPPLFSYIRKGKSLKDMLVKAKL